MKKSIAVFSILLSAMIFFTSLGGVFATWIYARRAPTNQEEEFQIGMGNFDYSPPLPDEEVLFLQRMDDILNQRYTTETVKDARKYLIEETIKVEWEENAPPYVGSMDQDYQAQIHELFGDIIDNLDVSFILKNQDINWDGYNEIACYSTSDPLDCCEQDYNGIVAVYLTVFTPVIDEQKNIIAYQLVCDSLYGFCNEIYYNPVQNTISSFSTEDWRDNLTYWHHELAEQHIPDDAIGFDDKTLYKYHYDSYHSRKYWYEGYPWGMADVWIKGRDARTVLADKIPWLS